MILDKAMVEKEIAELNLPENLLKLTQGRGGEMDRVFAHRCQVPWIVYEEDVTPHGRKLTPLWENNGRIFAFWEEAGRREYFKFDTELPEEYELLGYSIFAIVAHLLVWFRAEMDLSKEKVTQLAELLHYPDSAKIVEIIDQAQQSAESYQAFKTWEKNYRHSLPAEMI
ncbi:Hypothetical protein PBC10988_12790 [Planctomycetales bacterium 10988]|nr:Hypothetical protein PBC10988_12790 [Planctomycetales bacterium 10988]